MSNSDKKYWEEYYDDDEKVNKNNSQINVGRTQKGVPISDKAWQKTLDYISKLSSIDSSCDVVELCCGNGEVIGNLAPNCKKAIGVDYSVKLLDQMKSRFGKTVEPIYANVLDFNMEKESVDVVIIYASNQYFDEKETIELVGRCLSWLRKGGRLFMGDLPDELKKWDYVNKPMYRRDYIQRALDTRPMIGNWFQSRFFEALSDYFEGISVEIVEQPAYQNNASYRFDVLIKKA